VLDGGFLIGFLLLPAIIRLPGTLIFRRTLKEKRKILRKPLVLSYIFRNHLAQFNGKVLETGLKERLSIDLFMAIVFIRFNN